MGGCQVPLAKKIPSVIDNKHCYKLILGGGSRLDSKENTQSIVLCGVWGGVGWSLRGPFVVVLPWGGPLILSGWVERKC